MNKNKINSINNLYNYLEIAERLSNEMTVRLFDACAVIYHSEVLDKFKIDIIDKNEVKPLFNLLSDLSYRDFMYYASVLCDNYSISNNLDYE